MYYTKVTRLLHANMQIGAGENVELRVMEAMEIASLISQILHLLTCVRKRDYRLGMGMKKENPVRISVEEREQKKDETQDLWYDIMYPYLVSSYRIVCIH